MNTTQRDKITSLITSKLIQALKAEAPSAKLLDTAMKWLEKVESGDIKTPEMEQEKTEELRKRISLTNLPFKTHDQREPWSHLSTGPRPQEKPVSPNNADLEAGNDGRSESSLPFPVSRRGAMEPRP